MVLKKNEGEDIFISENTHRTIITFRDIEVVNM